MRTRLLHRGTTTVEFAIVGAVLMTILFAILQFGRIIFTLNALQESARRGARIATVCPVNDPGIWEAASFSRRLNLSTSNVDVQYYVGDDATGGWTKTPAAGSDVRFVRVRIVGYSIPIAIPFVDFPTFTAPLFSSTLPRESLGVVRRGNPGPCMPAE